MTRNEVPAHISEIFAQMDFQVFAVGATEPLKFGHFAEVHNFVAQEKKFWQNQTISIARQISGHWDMAHDELETALQVLPKGNYAQLLSQVASRLRNANWPNVIQESLLAKKILSFSPEISDHRAEAFLVTAISGYSARFTLRPDNSEVLSGFVEGTIFREPGILSETLRISQDDLKKNYETRLKDAESLKETYSALEKSLQDAFSENKQAVDTWRDEKIAALDTDLKNTRQRYKDLEQLYGEKLKLEAPAKYWKTRASRMRLAGFGWLAGSVIFFLGIGWLLWHNFIAPGTLVDAKELSTQVAATAANKDSILTYFASVKNIRSLVGFSVLASLYFFILRMLIKLTISSFHLALDAAEREQLTYVYLSLIDRNQKEGKDLIIGEDRKIILQSLFSRADTGLLAGDSAPTMPGADIINTVKGGGK